MTLRTSKFGSRITEYNGRKYHSAGEAKFAACLDLQKRAGLIRDWTPQVPFKIVWPGGGEVCKVVVDFAVTDASGTRYIEFKGHETPEYKLKKKLLLAAYPDIRYEVVRAKQ